MCGIAGLFDPEDDPDIDILERMNQCQTHRGPDDSGIFQEGQIGLAHRRLSIIDPETGRQPIFNEDGSVGVVFNGEIYNYRDLRESLSSAGHAFETETDTEVLVHLYEEEGPEFVERLDGMFSFALWDASTGRLVLARDPVGIKPLLVHRSSNRVAFASELPALLETNLDHGGLDRTAISQYFAFGYIPAPRTAFRNVSKVRPGERVLVDSDGVTTERFYTPTIQEHSLGLDRAATELRGLIEESVGKRLMSDVPLGAFLSGGIDSSIVVGTMARLMDEPVNTFTVGFEQDLFDESWAAREVAEYHGTNHHEVTLSADDVRAVIPAVLDRLGEPFADQSLIPSYVVARETADDVKVALSGDGGDELFAGYDKYRVEYLSKYYRTLPEKVRESAVRPVINSLPASRGTRLGTLAYQAQWFVNRSGPSAIPERHFAMMRVPDEDAEAAFDGVDPVSVGRQELRDQHSRAPPEIRRLDSLARMQAVDSVYSLPNQMLRKVDLASMYNSLEVRVPLLSTDVVEFALSLPTEYKITPTTRKRVLRRAFSDVLPRSVRKRKKQGFDMPIGQWFKDELADEFRRSVLAIDLGVLDAGSVLGTFDDHVAGRRDHGKFLWSVYVFKRWARRMAEQGHLDP